MKKPHIISVANQKGGVGKTTTALNIAAGLVKVEKKVLCIDFDPQSDLSYYMGYVPDDGKTISDLILAMIQNQPISPAELIRTNKEGIDFIPSDIELSTADICLNQAMFREQVLKKILKHEDFNHYDYIIIDCLPSLGVLLVNALIASDSVLIPVQAQEFALKGLGSLLNAINMARANANPNLYIEGVILTMAERTNMSKAVESSLKEMFDGVMFDTKIARSVEATNSTHVKKSLLELKNSKLGEEYKRVVDELLLRENKA